MNKYKVLCALVLLLGIGLGVGYYLSQKDEPVYAGLASGPINVIGSRVGTSTTGVNFAVNAKVAGQSATTSYPIWIGDEIDSAVFSLKIMEASSTANFSLSILASSDNGCATATTSSDYGNPIITKDINWYDGGFFLDGHAAQTLDVGTSSKSIVNPVAGTGKDLVLTNLNAKCLNFQVSGSSTKAYAELKIKSN